MRRRDVLHVVGGAAALWPFAAGAQRDERVRLIGILDTQDADSSRGQSRFAAFVQGLAQSGWIVGRNVRVEVRWGTRRPDRGLKNAAELVALAPDVIIAVGAVSLRVLLETTRTVPIVFVVVTDPVGLGYVESLARPGGNATGFLLFEFELAAKWLELLKQVAPNVTRVAVIRATSAMGVAQFSSIQSAATRLGVEAVPVNVIDASGIESAITSFARTANSGLILTASGLAADHGALVIALAARLRLPAIYFDRSLVGAGGLISYGADFFDQYRQAAGYVDRILRGEKPSELPVQAPTKFELAVNLKTAKALGLAIPPDLIARADEVIE